MDEVPEIINILRRGANDMEHSLEDNGKMYTVRLWKSMGEQTIEKCIELPFRPYDGLVIRVIKEETHAITNVEWDAEHERFNARCLTNFESIRNETYLVQPNWTQEDYDKRVDLHLKVGWEKF